MERVATLECLTLCPSPSESKTGIAYRGAGVFERLLESGARLVCPGAQKRRGFGQRPPKDGRALEGNGGDGLHGPVNPTVAYARG